MSSNTGSTGGTNDANGTPMQQTTDGNEEPVKSVREGLIRSSVNPDVWYGDYDTGQFSHKDIVNALEVITEATNQWFDWCDEYGEPGYEVAETGVVILGDYWCRERTCPYPTPYLRVRDDGTPYWELHGLDEHFEVEFKVFEETGCELEWYDEWIIDQDRDKAYRTQSDSYWWYPSFYLDDAGEMWTPDDDIEDWIEALSSSETGYAVPSEIFTDKQYEDAGMVRWGEELEWGQADWRSITKTIGAEHDGHKLGSGLDVIMVESAGKVQVWYRVQEGWG